MLRRRSSPGSSSPGSGRRPPRYQERCGQESSRPVMSLARGPSVGDRQLRLEYVAPYYNMEKILGQSWITPEVFTNEGLPNSWLKRQRLPQRHVKIMLGLLTLGETDPGEEQPMLCGANKQPSKTASQTRFMAVVSQLSDEDLTPPPQRPWARYAISPYTS